MDKEALKKQLNDYLSQFKANDFIQSDPIQFPHRFAPVCTGEIKMDSSSVSIAKTYSGFDQSGNFYDVRNVEIVAMIAAMIAWGNRKSIIKDIQKVMDLMEGKTPVNWLWDKEWKTQIADDACIHRTLKGREFKNCLRNLLVIYTRYNSLEIFLSSVCTASEDGGIKNALLTLGGVVFGDANMGGNDKSAFKRLNMAFRWLVRDSECDLGVWKRFKTKDLYIPLDVHVGQQSRRLGITSRRTMDWQTVEEITSVLRELDPVDPIKYDLALFQMGIDRKGGKNAGNDV